MGLIVRKDKNNIDKEVPQTNARLRNICNQKNIDYIDNTNIKEDHLVIKKLHLNKRDNLVFAPNLLGIYNQNSEKILRKVMMKVLQGKF